MKPIIGITVEPKHEPGNARSEGTLTLNWNYPEVIVEAGGVPIMIPPTADMAEIARLIDGWLIPGGWDMDASRFGEETHPKAELQDPARYEAEERLYNAVDGRMPILGICYGCQFLNVVRGGSLNQHLPDTLGHNQHTGGTEEQVELIGESKLAAATGRQLKGKSYHHQAVDRVGKGLKVTAKSPDGTVEAIEAEDKEWEVAVQWHPERSRDDQANKALIKAFVDAARKFAESKRG